MDLKDKTSVRLRVKHIKKQMKKTVFVATNASKAS